MSSSSSNFDLSDLQKLFQSGSPRPGANNTGSNTPLKFNFGCLWAIVGLWLLLTVLRSFVLVGAGERAVIFNRFSGTQPGQLGEGMHFVLPWIQQPTVYDIKTQTYTMSGSANEANPTAGNSNDGLTALTADGLPVTLEMSILYHIDPDGVSQLHQKVGPHYLEKIVRPQTRSHVRMVIAQYPVVDVYGGRRAKIIQQINDRLRRLFTENNLILDEALLRDVTFSKEFQQAIEQKQVAQQDVQRMTFVVQQADKERKRKIIEAQGEAESIRLKASALAKNPQLTQYEYVKNLPDGVRTIITDGRTIVNLGDITSNQTSTQSQQSANNAAAAVDPNGGQQ